MTPSAEYLADVEFYDAALFRLGWYISFEIRRKVQLFGLVGITRKFSIKMDRPHTCKLFNENHMGFILHSCCS